MQERSDAKSPWRSIPRCLGRRRNVVAEKKNDAAPCNGKDCVHNAWLVSVGGSSMEASFLWTSFDFRVDVITVVTVVS